MPPSSPSFEWGYDLRWAPVGNQGDAYEQT